MTDTTDTDTDRDDTVNVDLRTDDTGDAHAAENDTHGQTTTTPPNETERASAPRGGETGDSAVTTTDEFDARAEAKRLIENADGPTRAERVTNALESVEDHLRQLGQRLQQLQQREQKTDTRIEDLVEAKAHVRRTPATETVMRTFGGGITTTVPPERAYDDDDPEVPVPDPETVDDAEADAVNWTGAYDRADLLDEIGATIDAERGTLATIREEQGKIERGIGRAQEIHGELSDAREWVGDTPDHSAGAEPPTRGGIPRYDTDTPPSRRE